MWIIKKQDLIRYTYPFSIHHYAFHDIGGPPKAASIMTDGKPIHIPDQDYFKNLSN